MNTDKIVLEIKEQLTMLLKDPDFREKHFDRLRKAKAIVDKHPAIVACVRTGNYDRATMLCHRSAKKLWDCGTETGWIHTLLVMLMHAESVGVDHAG